MHTTILLVIVTLTSVTAQHNQERDHGHAYSSQGFILHHSHAQAPVHHEEYHHGHQEGPNYRHHEESYRGLNGHHEATHHGYHVEHQQGHNQESYYGQHGHQEQSNQGLLGYQGESHHGVSLQSILLHNDGHATKHIEYYGHPKYEFAYEVKDPHTHDFKYQHESRDGDLVKGVYSLHQPDGAVRVVNYHADKKNGFNADVKYEGHAVHAAPELHHHHH